MDLRVDTERTTDTELLAMATLLTSLVKRLPGPESACQHCGAFPDGAEIYEEPTDEVDPTTEGTTDTVLAQAATAAKVEAVTGEGLDVVKTEVAPPPPPAAEATDAAIAFADTQEVPPTQPLPEGVDTEAAPPPPPAAEAPAGVDLDKDGLPWDSRINTASKLKLKKEGTWKLTRNIDPTLVEQVRAELRAAMAASPANPLTPTPGKSDGPTVEQSIAATTSAPTAAPAPGAETVAPVPPAAETTVPAGSAEPLDFAGFMKKVTAAGVTEPVVLAAVNKAGLASIVRLATRPDLIPTVDAELFGVDP